MYKIENYLYKINCCDNKIKNDIHFYFGVLISHIKINYGNKENEEENIKLKENIKIFESIISTIFLEKNDNFINSINNYNYMIRWIYSVSMKLIDNPQVLDINNIDQNTLEIDKKLLEGTYNLICN